MPLCGFNEQMLNGLELFHEGLASNKIIDRFNNNKLEELERD